MIPASILGQFMALQILFFLFAGGSILAARDLIRKRQAKTGKIGIAGTCEAIGAGIGGMVIWYLCAIVVCSMP